MENYVNKPIKCKAAIAWEYNKPLVIEDIEVASPKEKEARIKIVSSGICHSDLFIMGGGDTTFELPMLLGHEAIGIVESVGPGTKLKPGDTVIPSIAHQCNECPLCLSKKTNICAKLAIIAGGTMLDGTTRITCRGKPIKILLGCGTFSEYTVCSEISLVKVPHIPKPSEACILGCCIPTGYGSVENTAKITPGSTCGVWGLGGVGMAAVLGCRDMKAGKIIGIDINPDKFDTAKKFGCTDIVNPKDDPRPIHERLIEMTGGGLDYMFICVGNTKCMDDGFKSIHPAWGQLILVGVTDKGTVINPIVFEILQGKSIKGTWLGDYPNHDHFRGLVNKYLKGNLDLSPFISHQMPLKDINSGIELLKQGKSIRNVINM